MNKNPKGELRITINFKRLIVAILAWMLFCGGLGWLVFGGKMKVLKVGRSRWIEYAVVTCPKCDSEFSFHKTREAHSTFSGPKDERHYHLQCPHCFSRISVHEDKTRDPRDDEVNPVSEE